MRIGIFGGTYDPVHFGHLIGAVTVLRELRLDHLLMTVASDPWQKHDRRAVTPASDRMAMVEIAVGELHGRGPELVAHLLGPVASEWTHGARVGERDSSGAWYSGIVASDIEIQRPGPTYTIDTVDEVELRFGAELDDPPVVVVGSDLVPEMDTWHQADELARRCELAVIHRSGAPAVPIGPNWRARAIPMPGVPISSSTVRDMIRSGEDVSEWVPSAVLQYIGARDLYATGR